MSDKPITATYPHPVEVDGLILRDCDMNHYLHVFANTWLAGWEAPLCAQLEEGKKYRMIVRFEEMKDD